MFQTLSVFNIFTILRSCHSSPSSFGFTIYGNWAVSCCSPVYVFGSLLLVDLWFGWFLTQTALNFAQVLLELRHLDAIGSARLAVSGPLSYLRELTKHLLRRWVLIMSIVPGRPCGDDCPVTAFGHPAILVTIELMPAERPRKRQSIAGPHVAYPTRSLVSHQPQHCNRFTEP